MASRTYSAPLIAEITRTIDGKVDTFTAQLGDIPIMTRSNQCHLEGLD